MEVNTIAYLQYDNHPIASSLKLKVKFRMDKKVFPVKLYETLCSTYWIGEDRVYKSFDDYLNHCQAYVQDEYLIKERVEDMVNNYFNNLSAIEKEKYIISTINNSKPIEINVKIK